ncbi:hypothetical protein ACQKMN_15650 [Ureibacillus composti]
MEYPLMDPPFEIKSFEKMTKKEAQIHFDWYVREVPKRVELIKKAYLETSGGKLEDLDLSSNSLVHIWKWFIPRIVTITKSDEEIEDELKNAPEWLKEKVIENKKKLTVGSLSLAMDLAIYFAEVFIHNFDKLYWGFVTKPKSLIYVYSPVIMGFSTGIELDPRNIVYNLTLKIINDKRANEEDLFNIFKAWENDI